jgi:hypothetical protein
VMNAYSLDLTAVPVSIDPGVSIWE